MDLFKRKLNIRILCISLLIITIMTIILPALVLGQDDAVIPLSALPGTTEADGRATLKSYVPGLFALLIGFAATLAVVMMIIGGLEWMLADSITNKSEGKRRIGAALSGLLLILSSFLILQTISPNLVNFSLDIQDVGIDPAQFGRTKGDPPQPGEYECIGNPRLANEGFASLDQCNAAGCGIANNTGFCQIHQ